MKKLFLVLLSISLLQSCTHYELAPIEGEIIVSISESVEHKNLSIYWTSHDPNRIFYARKGLYNVGDTIKFSE